MPLRSEADQLGIALNSMTENLKRISEENENEAWIKTGQAGLNDRMRGEQDLLALSKNIISYLTKYMEAQVGVIYLTEKLDEKRILRMTGSYAFTQRKSLKTSFEFGESLVGQAALEKEAIVLSRIPKDYLMVSSGLGRQNPKNILVQPFIIEGEVKGVVEIGSFNPFNDNQLELVRSVAENIAIATSSSQDREKMKELLEESQRKSEELLEQQEKLKIQSEELQMANEDLESKTKDLEMQKEDLQFSRVEVERKAKELELASKYKSEFLANMSHELRTPLNSLLILAKDLSNNDRGNLSKEQQKDAKIIYEGGLDLLNLINDILDLSKVEAGKLHIHPEEVRFGNLVNNLKNQFGPLAKAKNLKFNITLGNNSPAVIVTDGQRLEQIIKNLISNAIKFTEKGSVNITIRKPGNQDTFRDITLPKSEIIAISVQDTGIGIPLDKRAMIFEAFQQAEGGTSRQYGGTGLGLTISRELSRLLGGEIHINSTEGEGSTFTVYVPIDLTSAPIQQKDDAISSSYIRKEYTKSRDNVTFEIATADDRELVPEENFVLDDRANLKVSDHSILIIDPDEDFAMMLKEVVKNKGFKVLVAREGKEGLELAAKYQPNGILLDLKLPDINGLVVLNHLKFELKTRHIPVYVLSEKDQRRSALNKGALGFALKPIPKKGLKGLVDELKDVHNSISKEILIVEDDKVSLVVTERLLRNKQVNISSAATGNAALEKIKANKYDCIILDLTLPDISGFEVLKKMKANTDLNAVPVVVYTGKELTSEEISELHEYTDSIVIKGASTPERLLDEVSLFIHTRESKLSSQQKKIMAALHDPEQVLAGRKVLLVDDDMRNTYALSKSLTDAGMKVIMADNGKMALEKLKKEKGIEIVLMDVMMPVMDGYEAIREIRKNPDFKMLPIISLTAKAMPEDKSKSLEAGANDYLTKPVDVAKLLNLLRVWLYKQMQATPI
jgi:CheY-like chemotaxis protein